MTHETGQFRLGDGKNVKKKERNHMESDAF